MIACFTLSCVYEILYKNRVPLVDKDGYLLTRLTNMHLPHPAREAYETEEKEFIKTRYEEPVDEAAIATMEQLYEDRWRIYVCNNQIFTLQVPSSWKKAEFMFFFMVLESVFLHKNKSKPTVVVISDTLEHATFLCYVLSVMYDKARGTRTEDSNVL